MLPFQELRKKPSFNALKPNHALNSQYATKKEKTLRFNDPMADLVDSATILPKGKRHTVLNAHNISQHNLSQHNLYTVPQRDPNPKSQKTLPRQPLIKPKKDNEQAEFHCFETLAPKPEKPVVRKEQIILMQPDRLAEFDGRVGEIVMAGQLETLQYLNSRHTFYQVDCMYIEKKQKRMTWLLRAIVIDWMAQICYEYRLKRETFYLAITVFDNYFQRMKDLPLHDFQGAGAAAIFITGKLEEYQPLRSAQLSQATEGRYSPQDIRATQLKICRTLRFNLNGPTLNGWANRMMQQWDLFSDSEPDPFFLRNKRHFKRFDIDAYRLYRNVVEILDAMTLQIQTVQHKWQILALAVMYIVLGKEYGYFPLDFIKRFPFTTQYMEEDFGGYNFAYHLFLQRGFSIELMDLLPSVQYAATFFTLQITYFRPKLVEDKEIQAEEYAASMTYNPNMLEMVRHRYRGR